MRRRRYPGAWLFPLLLLCLSLSDPSAARGQMLHLDAIPWYTPADSTSRLALEVGVDHFFDPRYDWSMDRLLLTVILPSGGRGIYFLRMSNLTFDSGNVPVLQRWSHIRGEEMEADWPGSGRVRGFGQLEGGVCGPFALPVLGAVDFGAALGLPVGTDTLYPFSSTSMPLRFELRKSLLLGKSLAMHLSAGALSVVGSGREGLSDDAFKGGNHLAAELDWYRGRGARLAATVDSRNRAGRTSLLAGAQWWLPWTGKGSVGLKVARELEDEIDRAAQWYVTVAWRFDSGPYRAGDQDSESAAKTSAHR